MKLITEEMLEKYDACLREVKIFKKEWPDGARVTLKNARRAIELGLDVSWLANPLLSDEDREAFGTAQNLVDDQRLAATDAAWTTLCKSKVEARAEEDASRISHLACKRRVKKAHRAYDAAASGPWAIYNKAIIRILIPLLKKAKP